MVETIDAGAHRYVGAAFTVVDSGAIRVHRERCAKVRNRNVDCLKCAAACTSGCLSLDDGELVIDASKCVGCGTCAIAAFRQEDTDKLLQVDGKEEFAVYMAPVGVRDESKNEQNTKKLYANV